MKPFENKKADKKIPSRSKITEYLTGCKEGTVKENSDESKTK